MKRYHNPKHFSHKFELPLDNLPARKSDRLALHITYPSMFFGLALVILGIYEFFIRAHKTNIHFDTEVALSGPLSSGIITPNVFDAVIVLLGIGIMTYAFLSYTRYKKIYFDGNVFEVIFRPIFGNKSTFKEPLNNYEGVQMRIEFYQFGFMNKNKYIIELRHSDPKKTIPLYINTSGKNAYKIWKNYAKQLNKPMIFITDKGLEIKDVADLDKSLAELVKQGSMKNDFNEKAPIPANVDYTRKGDKTVIKVRKLLWDVYNIISWIGIIIFGGILAVSIYYKDFLAQRFSTEAMIWFYVIGGIGLIASIFVLFRKDKIVVKPHKVIVVHKFMLFSRKKDEMMKEDIEEVIINVIPSTGRHYLAIIANDKTIIFGKKLPVKDLKWVEGFLINEIVR